MENVFYVVRMLQMRKRLILIWLVGAVEYLKVYNVNKQDSQFLSRKKKVNTNFDIIFIKLICGIYNNKTVGDPWRTPFS